MKRSSISITALLVGAGLLFACSSLHQNTTQPIKSSVEATKSSACPGLPPAFKETDLFGTWVASYSLNDRDILTLKDDGTYKQIYDDPDASQHYESGWLDWWVEHRESGYIRLHLKGMRRAGEIESIFNRNGGGIDPELFTAIDYCENEVVEMPNEIVLIVTGSYEDVPRGIILRQTRLAGSEWTWSFSMQEDENR